MMGFSSYGAKATTGSRFGNVVANYALDNVKCSGSEESLEDCQYLERHNCENHEAAGVICASGHVLHILRI